MQDNARMQSVLILTAWACFAVASISCGSSLPIPISERQPSLLAQDDSIGKAFKSRSSNVQVHGEGKVTRVLSDDVKGPRHQRFIVRLASKQTVLVTHNIDIARRIDGLKEGDSVRFNGEYVWSQQGGIIHWTHHDPQGRHVAGWVEHDGKTFQ